MTNPPPVDRRPSRNRDLGFDEAIAMLIAFSAVGAILWWGLSQKDTERVQGEQPRPSLSIENSPSDSLFQGLTVPESNASQASGITSSTKDERVISSPGVAPAVVAPVVVAPAVVAPAVVAPAVVAPAILPGLVPSPTAAIDQPVAAPAVIAPAIAPPPELVVPAAKATPVEFSDVPTNYWAYPFIAALAQRSIITGFSDGTFKPDEPVSRSQYAALIETIFKSEAVQNPIAFKDVPGNFWATPAIDTAVKTGFLKGYPEGTFQPNQPISRVQVLTSLVNGLKVSQPTAPADVVKLYRDSAQIPAWAVPTAASATQSGMVVNYPVLDALNPNQPITRAEVSAIVHQALVAAGKLDPVSSDYIVRP
jgi:hypothetical protein